MSIEHTEKILLAHGGGGRLTTSLIENAILPKFQNPELAQLADSADIKLDASEVLFTTDSFVVKPLFFNGGDIGKLAICGTVNDLAVAGAKPVALSLSLIIEEGFEFDTLEKILASASQTARQADVPIVTGDTKVVEKGAADGIFINTAGIGTKYKQTNLSFDRILPGDRIIINGNIGDHGMTIMSQREGIKFKSRLKSDCAPLADLTRTILETGADVKFMRDPTRGGVAATTNEVAQSAGCNIELIETALPIDSSVRAAADMLGFDLLNIANEGKVVVIASEASADKVVNAMQQHPLGKDAAIIGSIADRDDDPIVELLTTIGGRRIVQMPYGRELPRIC
ncbi:Hydrogenase isoenzymes formation protein HypE [Anaerohalosphaera lusitana]|uniref:Hydrogenase isoenzymes formation protein HypE n=1 Tax=Anaerohalosphaera lusitana TaxID=1936003 RepID=A0A1U9NHX3_9BACT|nr:hydrogenase expression/formation protein HypE [Anaerohalosphaera lusitana]AQT67542.1 Hydrogenase isoenzymes formation protein HypE [Anaerohalosphaera lusitana]